MRNGTLILDRANFTLRGDIFIYGTGKMRTSLFGQEMRVKIKDSGGGLAFLGGCDFRLTQNISISGETGLNSLHLKYDIFEINGVSAPVDTKREYDTGIMFLRGGVRFSF